MNTRRELECIGDEIHAALDRVLQSGRFIGGPEVESFERAFSASTVSRFAVSVNSGSDALFLAVQSEGVGAGDEVITVGMTFVSTADAIVRNGATPVFVDVREDTLCMDPDRVEAAVTGKTRAIVPVHLFGQPADMDPIIEIADRLGLSVIEDACQAHGASYRGCMAGSIGRMGCFSFYPTKNLGAYGDTGIVVTDVERLAVRLRAGANYGMETRDVEEFVGINSRMDAFQAAVLGVKLPHLDAWNARRREIAALYDGLLSEAVVKPTEAENTTRVYHQYVIRSERRDEIRALLAENGWEALVHYPRPVHLQKAYRDLGVDAGLPVTEEATRKVLSLPLDQWMTDEEVGDVAGIVNSAIR
jgi:dTDP-4-amino-4,6-dideoxygalactose transaminase